MKTVRLLALTAIRLKRLETTSKEDIITGILDLTKIICDKIWNVKKKHLWRLAACSMESHNLNQFTLTHWGRETQLCVGKLDHGWFR